MTELPHHLSPWSRQLAIFPKEIALALGGPIARLASLIGDWHAAWARHGEPDGYDGIARRGPYERLLPTEWLLLEEVPEEFLRRVVAGEHAFLRRTHKSSTSGRRSVALFDTGIEQLGTPRIAHLALLILLAQRAHEDNATFEWGTLQDPGLYLHTGVSPATVRGLLRNRCRRWVTDADIDRWAESIEGPQTSELWFVGAPSIVTAASKHGASVIAVSDVLEAESPQRLRVQAFTPQTDCPREAMLELPSDRIAVQLLRDPFAAAPPQRLVDVPRLDVDSTMVFALSGRRLYVRGVDATIVSFKVPNSPRAIVGPPVAFAAPEGHRIVAVGWSTQRKRTVVASLEGREIFVHVLSKRGATAAQSERFTVCEGDPLPVHESRQLHPLGVHEYAAFLDDEGTLFGLCEGEAYPMAFLANDPAIGSSPAHGDVLQWMSLHSGLPQIYDLMTLPSGFEEHERETPAGRPPLHDPKSIRFAGTIETYAYATTVDTWVIVHGQRPITLEVPRHADIRGVMLLNDGRSKAGLLALFDDGRRVDLLRPDRSETLLTTASPVRSVAVSPSGRDIALLTSDGEVTIYSYTFNQVVLRSFGGRQP